MFLQTIRKFIYISRIFTFLVLAPSGSFADIKASLVIDHYGNIAKAAYRDSLKTAKTLDKKIDIFLDKPSKYTLENARKAWLEARIPYQQTEVYRFGNDIVDAWEGRVNSWPLDEGLIDYVSVEMYGTERDGNNLYTANVIANQYFTVNGKMIDASVIDSDFLKNKLHEAGGNEANVATGYHAIEFLLWGQDLNGNNPGSGNRPYTDFSIKNCTHGNCDRRRQYLEAVSELLVADLEEMVSNWSKSGKAWETLRNKSVKEALRTILKGMGSLAYGELAGERMKLGLLLGDPEEEHDCFSDNTHNSHYYNVIGIRNVYLGTYTTVNGTKLKGPSISQLIANKNPNLDKELKNKLDESIVAVRKIVKRAKSKEAYDQMIATGNKEGNATVQNAIDALIKLTKSIERAIDLLELGQTELEGSDSLNDPDSIFQ